MSNFVNEISANIIGDDFHKPMGSSIVSELGPENFHIEGLMSDGELKQFQEALTDIKWLPVSYSGMRGNYTPGDPIGSYRATIHNPIYAELLWDRIKKILPPYRIFNEYSKSDYGHHSIWRPVGVSPVFRVIKYVDGGKLVVHYDSTYIENDDKRTLQSLVMYVKHEDILGGSTRFLSDPQDELKFYDRLKEDQYRFARDEEVKYTPQNKAGDAIIFDHNHLHDGELVTGDGEKIIIRSDVFYEKVKDYG